MSEQKDLRVDRRSLFKAAAATAAGAYIGGCTETNSSSPEKPEKLEGKRHVLRFAHFTDIHITPEKGAAQGLARAIQHAQALDRPVDMIVTGGDNIMDSFAQDDSTTSLQWQLLRDVFQNHCKTAVRWAMGNHDVWGWDKAASKTTGNEPYWGKKRMPHEVGIPDRFYSFQMAGWKFIMLDSIQDGSACGKDYVGMLDDEQFEWLKSTLKTTPATTPVILVTHIPLVTVTGYEFMPPQKCAVTIPAHHIHGDGSRVMKLLQGHSNVKLCLSGHTHLVDRIEYVGITYICDGAVSGAWWKGDRAHCDEGYGLIDLYDDGTFRHEYVSYGWQVRA